MITRNTLEFLINWAMSIGAVITYVMMKVYKRQRDKALVVANLHSVSKTAHLVSIERNGRSLIMTFAKDGNFLEVETMALMSTDVNALRKWLIGDDHA